MTLQNFTLGTFSQGAAGGAASFESIATATGNGSATTITFSSIPSTYQHLQIRGISKRTGTAITAANLDIIFNSDTGSNYSIHGLRGDGASATASGNGSTVAGNIGFAVVGSGAGMTDIHGVCIIDILDYASTSKYKTVRLLSGADMNSTNGNIQLGSFSWRSTSAISGFTITSPSAFTTSSTFALYGIKGA